jgi:hypothetical protein
MMAENKMELIIYLITLPNILKTIPINIIISPISKKCAIICKFGKDTGIIFNIF